MDVTAIYPGSFDPITLGHVDVVSRASKLFSTVVMAVVDNPQKKALFDIEHRLELVRQSVAHLPNVKVVAFRGLLVKFAEAQGATVLIRGLRAISDYEYEFQLSQMNKSLYPSLETVFVMAKLDYTFVSSSMVKEVFMLGGGVDHLVPAPVQLALKQMPVSSQF